MRRDGWSIRIECRTRLSGTAESFQFAGDLVAYEGDREFARRDWTLAIPRQLV